MSRWDVERRKSVFAKLRPDKPVCVQRTGRYAGKTSMVGVLQMRVNISNGPRLALYHPKIQVVEYFPEHCPARAAIEVSALPEEVLVEIKNIVCSDYP